MPAKGAARPYTRLAPEGQEVDTMHKKLLSLLTASALLLTCGCGAMRGPARGTETPAPPEPTLDMRGPPSMYLFPSETVI